mmetsp:Transcript_18214/g.52629  ORF Transcript_18214/g.52629 Transcript_18214/m.52629 type:complete len:116 (-) Transcript_18214:151-498(-)
MSELRAYRFEHSNTFIHRRSGDDSGWTPAHPQLARWVKRQRYQYKLMSEGKRSTTTEERIRELERAGFVWSVRTDQRPRSISIRTAAPSPRLNKEEEEEGGEAAARPAETDAARG